MYRLHTIALAGLLVLLAPISLATAQDAVEEALKGCSAELKDFCSKVTPGEGRLVSCARAHQDKLSPECGYAINRAMYLLDFLGRTVTYVGAQCASDAEKYCSDVELGGQRILNCLRSNKSGLSKYCSLALQDIGKD